MEEKPSPSVEARVAKVEAVLEEVRARLNHLESEIASLRQEIRSNFRWTLGIMLGVLIPMWVTIILTILR